MITAEQIAPEVPLIPGGRGGRIFQGGLTKDQRKRTPTARKRRLVEAVMQFEEALAEPVIVETQEEAELIEPYDPGADWQELSTLDPGRHASTLAEAMGRVTRTYKQDDRAEQRGGTADGVAELAPCPFCRAQGWSLTVSGDNWHCHACQEQGIGPADWLRAVNLRPSGFFTGSNRVNLELASREAQAVAEVLGLRKG